MSWTRFPVYCEEASLGSLLEPFNAISSLAFVVVAYLLYRSFGSVREIRTSYFPLVIATALVGIGSVSWHTTRHVATFLLDVVPICILFILLLYGLAELIFGRKHALFVLVSFVVVQSAFFVTLPNVLNGSVPYLISLVLFAALAIMLSKRMPGADNGLAWSLAVFGFSILFRAIDRTLCMWVPFGTHFLWHVGSAVAIHFGVRTILRTKLASLRR